MSSCRGPRFAVRFLLLDHLEVTFETVLDVSRREITRIDEIRLDEACWLAGPLLDFPEHEQLPGRKAVSLYYRYVVEV